mgnify:CR=1 FL=1
MACGMAGSLLFPGVVAGLDPTENPGIWELAAELAPAATTRDVSAVLTSGLLVSIDSPIEEEDDYGGITFDFLPGVRQSLLAWGE